jgi:hypothetical protein
MPYRTSPIGRWRLQLRTARARRTGPPKTMWVSDVLWHASIAITKDVYGHLPEGDKRMVTESMSSGAWPSGVQLTPMM